MWRADRPARGRFREFYQCDVDAIGSRSMTVEAELLAAASDVLARLGFADFTIKLNHRQALAGMLEASGVAGDRQADALVALDKLDKIGRDGVAGELEARGVPAAAASRLLDVFAGGPESEDEAAKLERLRAVVGAHEGGRRAVDELEEILSLTASTTAAGRVRLDPSLARGLSYYTGAIMEIVVPDLAGSLAGGGRYDSLIGMFLGEEVPACGISLGLERILVVMGERGMFPAEASKPAGRRPGGRLRRREPRRDAARSRPSCARAAAGACGSRSTPSPTSSASSSSTPPRAASPSWRSRASRSWPPDRWP